MTGGRDIDKILAVSTLSLVVVGIVMVYSTSSIMASARFGSEYFFVKKHMGYALAGVLLFVAAVKIPYKVYDRLAYPAFIIAIILLACTWVPPLVVKVGGARRWVRFGPLAFQPSEPAKLAVVFLLARLLALKSGRIKDFKTGFLPNIILPGLIMALIVAEPDLGTSITIACIALVMLFVAGARMTHIAAVILPALLGVYLIVSRFAYMMKRVLVFLDPFKDPDGAGFQIVQSFIAFASGGVDGTGLGQGKQKLFYLPEAHTDFILSVIGEEFGFIGVASVVTMFAVFLACGLKIATKAKDPHARYLAFGLTFMVVVQAVINMGVVTGLLPCKGLTLPFISYGGTSLIINMIAVGILLNIYIVENGS